MTCLWNGLASVLQINASRDGLIRDITRRLRSQMTPLFCCCFFYWLASVLRMKASRDSANCCGRSSMGRCPVSSITCAPSDTPSSSATLWLAFTYWYFSVNNELTNTFEWILSRARELCYPLLAALKLSDLLSPVGVSGSVRNDLNNTFECIIWNVSESRHPPLVAQPLSNLLSSVRISVSIHNELTNTFEWISYV